MTHQHPLLTPRIEVLTGHPHSPLMQGEILQLHEDLYLDKLATIGVPAEDVAKYPLVFRPLAWHERREVGEMPEYISIDYMSGKEVNKVNEFRAMGRTMYAFYDSNGIQDIVELYNCSPATAQDYRDYLNSKKTMI